MFNQNCMDMKVVELTLIVTDRGWHDAEYELENGNLAYSMEIMENEVVSFDYEVKNHI